MLLQSKLTHPHKTSRKFRAEQYWWGGVGLLITASSPATAGPLFRFNPLGGGAGSRVRVHAARDVDPEFRFNPLGGGAGSGSQSSSWPLTAFATVSFQSPRRWGGVGLSANRATSARLNLSFNPLRGGAGSGWSIWQALLNAFACLVSIPSEVGRGQAREHGLYPSTPRPVCFVSIPLEVGRGRARWEWLFHSSSSYLGFNPLGGGAGSGSSPSRD